MTQSPAPYRISQGILFDPCLSLDQFPKRMDYACPAPAPQSVTEARRQSATRVLDEARRDIIHHLRHGARGWDEGGRRTVRLWDLMEISVASDGTDFRLEQRIDDPDASRFIPLADLSRPIGRFGWSYAFGTVLARACHDNDLNPKVLPGATGDWMRQVLRRTFGRYVDWRRLRRSVLRFLRPDPLIYCLVHRTFEDGHPTLDSFSWVARHERELARAGLEHPRLLPFLQLAEHGDGSPLATFEQMMAKAGLAPSARRKLERWGYAPFAHATEYGFLQDDGVAIARYANLLDRLQVMDEPPMMFTQLAGIAAPTAPDWFHRALLAEIERLADDCPEDPYPDDFEDALSWVQSGPATPDANQQRAGWSWILSQSWDHRIANDESARTPWPVPLASFEDGAHLVVPIRTRAELREEARIMRNCLDNFGDDCAAGMAAVFLVRRLDGARVGCFALTCGTDAGFWEVIQVAGKANTTASDEVIRIARTAAQRASPAKE